MRTRVTSEQNRASTNNQSGGHFMGQSRTANGSRADDAGSGAEGPARKRFQKATVDLDSSPRRPDPTNASANNSAKGLMDGRSHFANRRRQSLRDQKAPLGPRLPESSSGKRNHSDIPANTQVIVPNATKTSQRRQSSFNASANPNLPSSDAHVGGGPDDTASSFDFLPSVNFDDFHTNLASGGLDLNNFPVPGTGMKAPTNTILSNGVEVASATSYIEDTAAQAPETRIGRSGSFLRRYNSGSRKATQPAADKEPVGTTKASLAMRSRRQSHFAPPTGSNAPMRPARKSIGPGALGTDVDHSRKRSQHEGPVSNDKADLQLFEEFNALSNRASTREQELGQAGQPNRLSPMRNVKAKSMQPPMGLAQDYLSTLSAASDHLPSTSIDSPRSENVLSSKRLSVMPGHATGLGARTISPTDARRMKRISIMPSAPPIPQTPPTPQPEPTFGEMRSAAQSPSFIPRKSVTPSSARTTPDPHRKSNSSGISNTSSTSYSSFRNSATSIRLPQSLSTSRLPTPKTRPEELTTGAMDEVPPVPAIPKAYESPKTEPELHVFSSRKSSLPFDIRTLDQATTPDCIPTQALDIEPLQTHETIQQTRGFSAADNAQARSKHGAALSNNRRTLQPLRLPPLNLLPLSTPTTTKIAALQDEPIIPEIGTITPPPRRGTAKTPSTPMTASKATFSTRSYYQEDHAPVPAQMRSSSSHYSLRADSLSNFTSNNVDPSSSAASRGSTTRNTVSPFTSSSLPKSSLDFGEMRPKISAEYNRSNISIDSKNRKPTGPRAQTSKSSKDGTSATNDPASLAEHESSSFGSSLRRKLSLTRKRSTSKAQAERDSDDAPQPPKHNEMPPPRLPASATWSGPWYSSSSPTQKPSYLHSRRKPSNTDSAIKLDRSQSNTMSSDGTPRKESLEGTLTPGSTKTVGSALSSIQRSLRSNASKDSVKAQALDTKFDQDDVVADQEMKKLASKRRDAETAAKALDDLQRRATSKERVSPSQALRMARLNIFERGEIVDFKEIYFCGTQNAQKHSGDLNTDAANVGYDDERGDYHIVTGDHLSYRYEIVDILGKGSFGQVVRCIDHKTGGLVAIKIIRNKKRFHQQALVEVNILQKLREWDPNNKFSMVTFTQSFYFRGHLCISTELLGMNLYEFIKMHDFKGFSLKLIRRFTKQLLNSLMLLKSHKVIHCDLKPENILLAHPARSEIKVIDFGSSCLENEKVYTYIQSRFYRSPEVILGVSYGMPIDMWSLGCILAELLTGYPIFPGENEQEQLACIMEVFGPPEKHLIEKSSRKKLFFDSLGKPRLTISSKGKRRRPSSKSLQQALKCEDEPFLDFITRCLRWDPERRLKPDEAMRHEFITGLKPASRNTRTQSTYTISGSPIKRYNSITTPASALRPLPEPPATVLKAGSAVKTRDGLNGGSPVKAAPRRHSTVNGLQTNVGVKRASNGVSMASGSALPRLGGIGTTRAVSGKSDLASAAAAAATTKSR